MKPVATLGGASRSAIRPTLVRSTGQGIFRPGRSQISTSGPKIVVSFLGGNAMSDVCTPELEKQTARSLAELLRLVAEHQVAAFSELYQRSSPRVSSIARSILRDSHQADEVTQEVFLEIWQRAGSFDGSLGSASSWITRIAHGRSVDRVRSATATRARDLRYHEQTAPVCVDLVVEDVLRRADAHGLHRAMATVTDLQRQALTVTYLLGNSQREASVLLQIPLATLKTRIRDGLKRLRSAVL